jgi:hypothetical protein
MTLLRVYGEFPGAGPGLTATVSSMDIDLTGKPDSAVSSVLRPVDIYFS